MAAVVLSSEYDACSEITWIFTKRTSFIFSAACWRIRGSRMGTRLPREETEICKRVRIVREAARLSRPMFGRFLALDSSKLANIESLRVPLDYISGAMICRVFRVSPRWLTTGQGRPTLVLSQRAFDPVPEMSARTPFSEFYASHLSARVAEIEVDRAKKNVEIDRVLEQREKSGHNIAESPETFERSWLEAAQQVGAVEQFEISAELARAAFGSPFTVEFENELAIVTGFDDKMYPMHKPIAPSDLVNQVKTLTAERGTKSALAARLGVSRQRLNEWLSGRSKPNAHYTLKLLAQLRTLKRNAVERSGKNRGDRVTARSPHKSERKAQSDERFKRTKKR